jgi:hypothetical protein
MKTTNLVGKFVAFTAIAVLGFVTSCQNDETVGLQDIADSSSESLSDSYFQDADDFSITAVDNNNLPGRVADDGRLSCAEVSFSDGSTTTSGTLNIDFGAGCSDGKGNIRKGKVVLAYEGTRGQTGFTINETFDNYYINGIKLEDESRVITRVEAPEGSIKHTVVLTGGKATWPDATFATRASSFTRTINVAAGTVTLEGSASGTSRKGKSYTMTIEEPLIHKTSCIADGIYMAVQGKKVFNIQGTKQITIDYGDGTCDKTVTITLNGITKDITIGKS